MSTPEDDMQAIAYIIIIRLTNGNLASTITDSVGSSLEKFINQILKYLRSVLNYDFT